MKKNEIATLVEQGRMRNALLTAKTLKCDLRAAAARVMRLSNPGTPERLFTLMSVAEESDLTTTAIVDEIIRAQKEQRKTQDDEATKKVARVDGASIALSLVPQPAEE